MHFVGVCVGFVDCRMEAAPEEHLRRIPRVGRRLMVKKLAVIPELCSGKKATLPDLLKKSGALYNLTRLINTRLGMSRKDDSLPYKVRKCPIQTGATAGKAVDQQTFDRLLDLYYEKRGWSSDGIPAAATAAQFTP